MTTEFVGSLYEVPLVGDVVALEDRAGLMSGYLHAHSLGDPRAHHVAHGGAPQVMKQQAGYSSRSAGFVPGEPEVPHGLAFAVEDQGITQDAASPGLSHCFQGFSGEVDGASLLALRVLGLEPDETLL